tara:strand:- start:65 stop:322 length:258 start_codon:yes stop_codon:yes gene_type:complete
MDCLECRGRSGVIETERLCDGVRRVRECKLCGVKWVTMERFHVKLKGVRKPRKKKPKKRVRVRKIRSKESVSYARSVLDNDDYDF